MTEFTLEDVAVQAWELDRLTPADDNHKNHTEESVTKLAKSMDDMGQIQPCIVDKNGEIIAGHGRWMAAKKLGWNKIKIIQLPVDRVTAMKMRIADNLMTNQNIDQDKLLGALSEINNLIEGDLEIDTLVADGANADMLMSSLEVDLDINLDAISDDMTKSVDDFSNENDELVAAARSAETPLGKVFGFTKVTADQAIILKDFMALVMHESDETEPGNALADWAETLISGSS